MLSSRRFIKILEKVCYVKMIRIYHKYIGINRDHVWIAKVCQNGFEVMKFVAWNRITASNYWDVACCYQDQRISSSLDLKALRFSFYHPYHLIQHTVLHLYLLIYIFIKYIEIYYRPFKQINITTPLKHFVFYKECDSFLGS